VNRFYFKLEEQAIEIPQATIQPQIPIMIVVKSENTMRSK